MFRVVRFHACTLSKLIEKSFLKKKILILKASRRRRPGREYSRDVASHSAPVTPADAPEHARVVSPSRSPVASRCATPIASRDVTPFESQDEESLLGFMEPLQNIDGANVTKEMKTATRIDDFRDSHHLLSCQFSPQLPSSTNDDDPTRSDVCRKKDIPSFPQSTPNYRSGYHRRLDGGTKQAQMTPPTSSKMRKSESFPSPKPPTRPSQCQPQKSRNDEEWRATPPAPARLRSWTTSPVPQDLQPPPLSQLHPSLSSPSAQRAVGSRGKLTYRSSPRMTTRSIPSLSKITTTFSAGDEEDDDDLDTADEEEHFLGHPGRHYGDSLADRAETPIFCRSLQKTVAHHFKDSKSHNENHGFTHRRFSKEDSTHATETLLNGKGLASFISPDAGGRADEEDDREDTEGERLHRRDSSSPSLVGARNESPSETEFYEVEEKSQGETGRKLNGGANYDRFDTGFWEDESSFGPDSGSNGVMNSKFKTKNDGEIHLI